MLSTEDSKVEQPVSKTLARHPLVLLDQQLKNLVKEDDVPNQDNRKCDGTLKPEEARSFNSTPVWVVAVGGISVRSPDLHTAGGVTMGKIVECAKVDPSSGCQHVVRGATEEEVLKNAAEHAKLHGIREVTPELKAKVKAAIRDEK
jgi:predicted small metal-binding protein